MKKYIVGGLAVVGGVCITKVTADYILTRYKKEIVDAVTTRLTEYFFAEEEPEPPKKKKKDPLKEAVMAYMDARKGA